MRFPDVLVKLLELENRIKAAESILKSIDREHSDLKGQFKGVVDRPELPTREPKEG